MQQKCSRKVPDSVCWGGSRGKGSFFSTARTVHREKGQTVIINLMSALLEDGRAFFHSSGNCWVYLHYLNLFYIPLVTSSFIKTHNEVPSSISSGTVFLYFLHAAAECHGNNSCSDWKTITSKEKSKYLLGPQLFLF